MKPVARPRRPGSLLISRFYPRPFVGCAGSNRIVRQHLKFLVLSRLTAFLFARVWVSLMQLSPSSTARTNQNSSFLKQTPPAAANCRAQESRHGDGCSRKRMDPSSISLPCGMRCTERSEISLPFALLSSREPCPHVYITWSVAACSRNRQRTKIASSSHAIIFPEETSGMVPDAHPRPR